MSRTLELQNLVKDIKSCTKDRRQFVQGVKTGTQQLLGDYAQADKDRAAYIKHKATDTQQFIGELNEESKKRANETEDFLKKSEQTRLADFDVTIKDVKSAVKDVLDATHKLRGEHKQFVQENKQVVGNIKADAQAIIVDFAQESKATAQALAPLRKKVSEEAEDVEVEE